MRLQSSFSENIFNIHSKLIFSIVLVILNITLLNLMLPTSFLQSSIIQTVIILTELQPPHTAVKDMCIWNSRSFCVLISVEPYLVCTCTCKIVHKFTLALHLYIKHKIVPTIHYSFGVPIAYLNMNFYQSAHDFLLITRLQTNVTINKLPTVACQRWPNVGPTMKCQQWPNVIQQQHANSGPTLAQRRHANVACQRWPDVGWPMSPSSFWQPRSHRRPNVGPTAACHQRLNSGILTAHTNDGPTLAQRHYANVACHRWPSIGPTMAGRCLNFFQ